MVDREDVLARSKKVELREVLSDEWLSGWFGGEIRNELLALKGKEIKKGELLLKKGKFFKKRLLSPVGGELMDVDEFCNLKVKIKLDEKSKLLSPIKARVSNVSDGEITLEFEAWELKGICIFSGKTWGNISLFCLEKTRDLEEGMNGEIVFTKFLDQAFVTKAEVLGINGIVLVGDSVATEADLEFRLPVLKITDYSFKGLKSVLDEKKRYRVLLNSETKRLLFVVE